MRVVLLGGESLPTCSSVALGGAGGSGGPPLAAGTVAIFRVARPTRTPSQPFFFFARPTLGRWSVVDWVVPSVLVVAAKDFMISSSRAPGRGGGSPPTIVGSG